MKLLKVIPFLLLLTGCRDNINVLPAVPSTPAPTAVVQQNKIEYRVNSNASSVKITYSFPTDGLTLVTSVPPYSVTYETNSDILFLSLSANPVGFQTNVFTPFTSVQIFANGIIFREATSSDFLLGTISVSGTWRK